MINIALIDDEENARFLLRNDLYNQYNDIIDNIYEADGVRTGLSLIRKQKIDVLFLDIQLRDGTGFEILDGVDDLDFEIVFVTAYNDFALKAFEFFAFAYLVKPFKTKDLCTVIDKYIHQKETSNSSSIKLLAETFSEKRIKKIVLSDIEGFQIVELNKIIYVMSDNNYSEFYLENGKKIVSSKTLMDYERVLETEGFFRCHRRYLINLSMVLAYIKTDGGYARMNNGTDIPIGRRRLKLFRSKFL